MQIAVHRLRRFRKGVGEEIAAVVDDPSEVENEVRALFADLAPSLGLEFARRPGKLAPQTP